MPRKEFEAFTRLDASDVNTFLMDQSVMSFAGTAARGSAIPSPVTGMTTYLEDSKSLQIYDGSSYFNVGPSGLTLVKTQTIGTAVSSITVSNAFTTEFDNYKILITGGVGSLADTYIGLALDSVNTGYFASLIFASYTTGSVGSSVTNNGASFFFPGYANLTSIGADINLINVSTTEQTRILAQFSDDGSSGVFSGFCTSTASHTSFTLTTSSGTLTGGTIRVYGYRNA